MSLEIKLVHIIISSVLVFLFNNNSFSEENKVLKAGAYFPVNNNITLIYSSTFGECTTRYIKEGDFTVMLSEGDKFKYRQKLLIKEDGIFVDETYQYLKIFLFIKKEGTYSYGIPLLRFPLPLTPGLEWKWVGDETTDGESSEVTVSGKVFEKEFINTKAGKFQVIKIESVIQGTSNSKNKVTEWFAEGIGLIKAKIIIEGGGFMGFVRDILGYGVIEFELKEIRKS